MHRGEGARGGPLPITGALGTRTWRTTVAADPRIEAMAAAQPGGRPRRKSRNVHLFASGSEVRVVVFVELVVGMRGPISRTTGAELCTQRDL